jgi:hypothetical protein
VLPAVPIALVLSLSLAASPWPSGRPTPAHTKAAAPTTATPASIAGQPSPFTPYVPPSAPAPTPTFERASYRVAPAPEYATTSVTQAPEPPARSIAYARPYPEQRYSPRERGMLATGYVLLAASIVPAAFAIRSGVLLARANDRYLSTPDASLGERERLRRETFRQFDLLLGTGVAAIVVMAAAAILIGLATRKRKRENPEPAPRQAHAAIEPVVRSDRADMRTRKVVDQPGRSTIPTSPSRAFIAHLQK